MAYIFKMEKETFRLSLRCREAVDQRRQLQTNSLQIWHGYTMESPFNSHIRQLSLRVFDAMLEMFKRVLELLTYGMHLFHFNTSLPSFVLLL